MFITNLVVWPYRHLINRNYLKRPLASSVISAYIKQRGYPSWTSFFLPYKAVQDNLYGEKHFNFIVNNINYHILRVGCYPYVKYHCTQKFYQDLSADNCLYKLLTALNLGIPCIVYGIAATFLIKHTDYVFLKDIPPVPIHFLIAENHN